MSAEFLAWWELHQREADGSAMQAAWLAWRHRDNARDVAQLQLDTAKEEATE